MLLCELFESESSGLLDNLQQSLLDMLTPLAVRQVRFVKIQQVIDDLKRQQSGLVITRALAMQLLDPNKLKIVSKIEGDKIYLATSKPPERMVSKSEEDKDKAHVADTAIKNAKSAVKS